LFYAGKNRCIAKNGLNWYLLDRNGTNILNQKYSASTDIILNNSNGELFETADSLGVKTWHKIYPDNTLKSFDDFYSMYTSYYQPTPKRVYQGKCKVESKLIDSLTYWSNANDTCYYSCYYTDGQYYTIPCANRYTNFFTPYFLEQTMNDTMRIVIDLETRDTQFVMQHHRFDKSFMWSEQRFFMFQSKYINETGTIIMNGFGDTVLQSEKDLNYWNGLITEGASSNDKHKHILYAFPSMTILKTNVKYFFIGDLHTETYSGNRKLRYCYNADGNLIYKSRKNFTIKEYSRKSKVDFYTIEEHNKNCILTNTGKVLLSYRDEMMHVESASYSDDRCYYVLNFIRQGNERHTALYLPDEERIIHYNFSELHPVSYDRFVARDESGYILIDAEGNCLNNLVFDLCKLITSNGQTLVEGFLTNDFQHEWFCFDPDLNLICTNCSFSEVPKMFDAEREEALFLRQNDPAENNLYEIVDANFQLVIPGLYATVRYYESEQYFIVTDQNGQTNYIRRDGTFMFKN
jgi:hypothetical protein